MRRIPSRTLLVSLMLPLLSLPGIAQDAKYPDSLLQRLQWRNIGPATMGGRIDEFAVVESKPGTVYVASASGGIFKSENFGTTWKPIFEDQSNPRGF